MIDAISPNGHAFIDSVKSFWAACAKSNLRALHEPTNYTEFIHFEKSLLGIKLDDFAGNPDFKSKLFSANEAEYLDIYKDQNVQIMAIFMPPKVVYPIHDHPEMLVVTKVLKGQTIMSHYDIQDKEKFYSAQPKPDFSKVLAKKSHVNVLKEHEFNMVFPHKGNLHSIETINRTVILDILFNYYDDKNRPCSFFTLGQKKSDTLYEMYYHKDDN